MLAPGSENGGMDTNQQVRVKKNKLCHMDGERVDASGVLGSGARRLVFPDG